MLKKIEPTFINPKLTKAKDDTLIKQDLRARLAKTLDRNVRGIYFNTQIWTIEMLQDSLTYCESYSNVKLRNVKWNEYKLKTK